jgi:hypothetical protein
LIPGKDLNLDEDAKDALVVTPYNQFLYRVKAVRRDCNISQPMGCERGLAPPMGSAGSPTVVKTSGNRPAETSFKDYYM